MIQLWALQSALSITLTVDELIAELTAGIKLLIQHVNGGGCPVGQLLLSSVSNRVFKISEKAVRFHPTPRT